jgi:hypothetical protein
LYSPNCRSSIWIIQSSYLPSYVLYNGYCPHQTTSLMKTSLHPPSRLQCRIPNPRTVIGRDRSLRTLPTVDLAHIDFKANLCYLRFVNLFGPNLPPLGLPVNRGAYRFGRYKNPHRPLPPPRASQMSQHSSRVSGLTLAHSCSHTLTYSRQCQPPMGSTPREI